MTKNKDFDILKNKIRKVFGTADGRYVLNWLLEITGLYSDCFTGNSQTFFLEGKRSVGLEILDTVMQANKKIYIDLLKEVSNDG